MNAAFWILTGSGVLLGLSYLATIAKYCYGWQKLNEAALSKDETVDVSVIIAVRNEERGIVDLMDALIAQSYPRSLTEIIIVNDHSTDYTVSLLESFLISFSNIKLLKLPDGRAGKKEAIAFGIANSKGELIVTTDGDCVMGNEWLSSLVSFYKKQELQMVVGPVAFQNDKTVFQKMQSLEFMALISSGGGSLFFHKAILCNGANLAFSRKSFDRAEGYTGVEGKASGDDVLLMYKIQKAYPGKVGFLKNDVAIVYTEAKKSAREFFNQRKRWASKGFSALNADTKRVSLLIYLFNAWLVLVPWIGYLCFRNTTFHPIFLEICLILAGIKCLIDFLLLFLSASFFKRKGLLLFFIPQWIIYGIYVVLFGLIGPFGKYEWKGRKTN